MEKKLLNTSVVLAWANFASIPRKHYAITTANSLSLRHTLYANCFFCPFTAQKASFLFIEKAKITVAGIFQDTLNDFCNNIQKKYYGNC